MTRIKSYSVGNGDMFYIEHISDNFTIIDCCFSSEEVKGKIIDEIKEKSLQAGITRFISTHPDEDHILGLKELDNEINILNFYCVQNKAIKKEPTEDFNHYCDLRDNAKKAFYIYKGCSRKWMNQSCNERNGAGISILWPDLKNEKFIEKLEQAEKGESPNDLSPVIKYSLSNHAKFLWMGDLTTEYMESITDNIVLEKVNVVFAPHHGRKSGKIPKSRLDILNPELIVVGEAPSEHIEYYSAYNTFTQNSTKDIIFDCVDNDLIDVYVGSETYLTPDFLQDNDKENIDDCYYLGSLSIS